MSDNPLEHTPEYILAYIAPMACGEKERAELIRRQQNGTATGERLGRRSIKP